MTHLPITVTDQEITLRAEYFCRNDNTCANKAILADLFCTKYQGQKIRIEARDGENLLATGLLTLMYEFCELLKIELNDVIVCTHDTKLTEPFIFEHLPLGIFLKTNSLIPKITADLDQAKFVGLTIGRFTIERLRLAYELDQAFPDDTFLTFHGRHWPERRQFKNIYESELAWFDSKQFDQTEIPVTPVGSVGFDQACQHYPDIWNRYQIEVIAETDPVSGFWFTEKTARCLATGKPFVLLNGYGTLNRLREMGFFTYGAVIDESYDEEFLPTRRTQAIVKSLKSLYNDKDRDSKIQQLYELAKQNQEIYKQFVKDQETTNVQSKI